MKTSLLILTLANLASAATASAAGFSYDFLSGGKISFCPGVAPRVLAVGTVGATRSGGCCGSEENWTQAMMNGPFMPHRDIRADIESQIRGMNYPAMGFDNSVGKPVTNRVALMEDLHIRNSTISACVSRLDLVSVNQNRGGGARGTEVKFDIGFKYFVSLDGESARQTLLVQEVEGQKTVNSAFYNLYYDSSPRSQGFINNSWDELQKDIGNVLAPIPNAAADQGMERVNAYLDEYLGSNGQ